jgi:hypothetical protein
MWKQVGVSKQGGIERPHIYNGAFLGCLIDHEDFESPWRGALKGFQSAMSTECVEAFIDRSFSLLGDFVRSSGLEF